MSTRSPDRARVVLDVLRSALFVLALGVLLVLTKPAFGQLNSKDVAESTRALDAAGPWLAALCMAAFAWYLERLRRTQLAEKHTENTSLRQQLTAQQEALVASLRENAALLLQHSKESNAAFGRVAISIEKVADQLGGLEEVIRDRIPHGRVPR